ncbi:MULTISPECIES: hypothetical protein [unclassified Sedimentibacter]|uniref:hypothetical protein n=1 Tax=unclassified Sedimentibacter TaxID=2649220 RepID=UPI0027DFB3BE|nr:hypothetical protein [Sedimentibacter sp. MB35-C1]WMJ78304.1 hypothetical protein RBQ61_05060 [Sedimentibacter sp. MB35-C1]
MKKAKEKFDFKAFGLAIEEARKAKGYSRILRFHLLYKSKNTTSSSNIFNTSWVSSENLLGMIIIPLWLSSVLLQADNTIDVTKINESIAFFIAPSNRCKIRI